MFTNLLTVDEPQKKCLTRTMGDWAGEDLRELIIIRSGGICECCGNTRYESLHHRTPRGMGGSTNHELNTPANIVAVCGHGTAGCHGRIEISRTIATRYGWLVPRGQDPEETPIIYRGTWAGLTTTGTVHYIPSLQSMLLPNPKSWKKVIGK